MRGVIYARYSSHAQREESIEQQIYECRKFADREGISIVDIYADKAVTGRTDKRREFQRLLRDADKKRFDVVIAYKSNRIARNMLNALQYEERLDKAGIKTLYVKEAFGDSAAGRFAFRMMLSLNQFYSENMSEDIKRGMLDNAQDCKVNGAIPIGYKKGDDGRYALDPVGAMIVHEIYLKYANGVPLSEIAASLNARGFRTSHNKAFNKSSFHKILTNETYLGKYQHSGVVVEGGVPRIIEDGLFYEVQKCLSQRRTHRRGEEFILTGKLFCGHCNAPMTGVSGDNGGRIYYYYICRNRKIKQCDKKPVRKEDIERRVAEAVRDKILTDEVIEQVADQCMEYQAKSDLVLERETLKNRRDDAKRSVDNILAAMERGIVTESVQRRLLELEQTIADCESELASLEKQKTYTRDQIIFALNKFKAESLDSEQYMRVILQKFVKAVYLYDDGGLRLECWYGDGIYLHSPKGDSAPPYILRSNILVVLAEFFSIRV